VGVPPLRFLAARCQDGPELVAFIGARERSRLLCLDDFASFGAEVVASTDDGSAGYHGTAVAALESYLERERVDQILTCGPTPMMRATATLALARGIPCQVCLEARMACALGACLSCVVETTAPGWQKYQRVCTEGPVFDACNVVWGTLSPLCAV
ncbi:MAG: dihydroorotate dehydrogenase electron transfer subunit, partial [Armatimonadetes bacterium]|nr:dihydroorotate dehydrogenase electron transfer subunit [Armatimonadota bacterium]